LERLRDSAPLLIGTFAWLVSPAIGISFAERWLSDVSAQGTTGSTAAAVKLVGNLPRLLV
jgi:hypothetical protein